MSEIKTIKGKVLFCVIPIIGDQVSDEYYSEWLTMVTKQELGESFRLSTITEEQASLLVDFDNDDNYKDYLVSKSCYQLKTAKESLFSLLKANGCKTKEMCDNLYDKVENAADDYLLIIKQ